MIFCKTYTYWYVNQSFFPIFFQLSIVLCDPTPKKCEKVIAHSLRDY